MTNNTSAPSERPPVSDLDRYPATPAGHTAFPSRHNRPFWERISFWDSSSSLSAAFNKHREVLMRKWQLRYDRAKKTDDPWWVRENLQRQREWERLCRRHGYDPIPDRPDKPRPTVEDARPTELHKWLPEIIKQVEMDRFVLSRPRTGAGHQPFDSGRFHRWAVDLCTEHPELGEPPDVAEESTEYGKVCRFVRWFNHVYDHFQRDVGEVCGEASTSVIPAVTAEPDALPRGQLDETESSFARDAEREQHISPADRPPPDVQDAREPYSGGEMVFYPDRVELCGAVICHGPCSEQARKALDLLRQQGGDGAFEAYSGIKLAEKLALKGGQDGAAGLIRDLRARISEALKHEARIECGRHDVILSGGPGYRFSKKLSVHYASDFEGTDLQGHVAPSRSQDGPVVPVTGGVDDPVNVPVNDPVKPDDPVNAHAPATRGPVKERRDRLLEAVSKGRKLRVAALADELGCSERTVKRDLDALRDQIEFVGAPKTGNFRLRQPR